MPRVFSYVVAKDSGFAPNPFHGWLTLACCKPQIRAHAQVGDLVVGLSAHCERVVYVLEVEERLEFNEYWKDVRFRRKRANMTKEASAVERRGDNIYEPSGGAGFKQHPSQHYDNDKGRERLSYKKRDLEGRAVLVGRRFAYFGRRGRKLPGSLEFLRVGRAHRCRFDDRQVAAVRAWFEKLELGVHGRPTIWKDGDESWGTECGSC
jgi:hypothetical protein